MLPLDDSVFQCTQDLKSKKYLKYKALSRPAKVNNM